ncbi:MAG: Rrf2 family transcriptional regulator [Candidatus Hydrogenedentota bacterium]|nr:MAG: Rrf2 family transcriptional regulator [Candidatus Hydrogenedentota bacterium]
MRHKIVDVLSKLLYIPYVMFSVKTEYALRALSQIANSPKTTKRSDIAEKENIPVHFLEQILLALKKKNIIISRKGPGGGFELAKPLSRITLWEVFSAVEFSDNEPLAESCYPGYIKECHVESDCHIRSIWIQLRKDMEASMKKIRLGILLPSGKQKEAENAVSC